MRAMIQHLSDQFRIRLTIKYGTTYFYEFSYNNVAGALGADHADEVKYTFDNETDIFADAKDVASCMKKLWTNFANYR
ncbi:hypothetical protein QE152_g36193 [Popillia japonica]|uniref:Uncharacterized protein n=1 Tax=Popillia japonica TaxID=7064 RepID=A0AAW1IDM0_POPJA